MGFHGGHLENSSQEIAIGLSQAFEKTFETSFLLYRLLNVINVVTVSVVFVVIDDDDVFFYFFNFLLFLWLL